MAILKQPTCDVCHERPATIFVSHGGVSSSAFCQACAPSELQETARELDDARCDYCGREACSPIADLIAPTEAAEKPKYICRTCVPEYHRFLHAHLPRDWAGLSDDQGIAAIRKFIDEMDAHMKDWVVRSGSHDAV